MQFNLKFKRTCVFENLHFDFNLPRRCASIGYLSVDRVIALQCTSGWLLNHILCRMKIVLHSMSAFINIVQTLRTNEHFWHSHYQCYRLCGNFCLLKFRKDSFINPGSFGWLKRERGERGKCFIIMIIKAFLSAHYGVYTYRQQRESWLCWWEDLLKPDMHTHRYRCVSSIKPVRLEGKFLIRLISIL